MRPGPTATTSPSWGFSFAVSGMTRPDAVTCSASSCLMTMRSSSGLMETDTGDLFLKLMGWHTPFESARTTIGPPLAVDQCECQRVLSSGAGLGLGLAQCSLVVDGTPSG